MALRPIKTLSDAEVSPGDVIRYGTAGRWMIVCEVDNGPQGYMARMRYAFGANAGEWWDETHFGLIIGWTRLDQNRHALYRRYGRHSAKDRRNARTDAIAVLGQAAAEGWYR